MNGNFYLLYVAKRVLVDSPNVRRATKGHVYWPLSL